MERIYSIIEIGRVKKLNKKGAWIYILNKKLKYYTKEIFKYFNIAIIGLGFITAIILIKYKPIYEVSISGEDIGYVQNKEAFVENLKQEVEQGKNVDTVDLEEKPEYELKFVDRNLETNEEEVASKIEENLVITYKYYEIALNDEELQKVDTIDEAEEVVNEIKEEIPDKDLDLTILEKFTQNEEELTTEDVEVAKADIQTKVTEIIEKQEEQERIDALPDINGIKLAVTPISGKITSRYGVSSSIRSSRHTGLDISAKKGTPIKVVADGTVTFAKYNGSYGNLVKVDHGNGVETWYAHTNKMYVKAGTEVKAGDVIAEIGSTGNSTGPHLHLEIRVNGKHINPQLYLYK